jgi:hypothetical protein
MEESENDVLEEEENTVDIDNEFEECDFGPGMNILTVYPQRITIS